MKNITSSADEKIIESVQARARAQHTTPNEQFREWLAACAREKNRTREYDAVVAELKGKR